MSLHKKSAYNHVGDEIESGHLTLPDFAAEYVAQGNQQIASLEAKYASKLAGPFEKIIVLDRQLDVRVDEANALLLDLDAQPYPLRKPSFDWLGVVVLIAMLAECGSVHVSLIGLGLTDLVSALSSIGFAAALSAYAKVMGRFLAKVDVTPKKLMLTCVSPLVLFAGLLIGRLFGNPDELAAALGLFFVQCALFLLVLIVQWKRDCRMAEFEHARRHKQLDRQEKLIEQLLTKRQSLAAKHHAVALELDAKARAIAEDHLQMIFGHMRGFRNGGGAFLRPLASDLGHHLFSPLRIQLRVQEGNQNAEKFLTLKRKKKTDVAQMDKTQDTAAELTLVK